MILPAGFTVLFGGIDVSLAVHDFSASTRIADRARATFQLDVRDLPSSAVDLGSIIEVRQRERPIFTGEVVSARVDGDRVAISAATGSNLTDTTVARQTTFGLTPHEQVRSVRSSGVERC